MKKLSNRALVVCVIAILLGIAADQATKIWSVTALAGGRRLEVIPKALAFVYVENPNAAFGLGNWLPPELKVYALLALTIALTLGLCVMLLRTPDLPSQIGFAATISGAIGNIIDRIQLGYVRDFIYWHGGFSWPNFNVADMLVVCGVGVLLVFGSRAEKRAKSATAGDEKR